MTIPIIIGDQGKPMEQPGSPVYVKDQTGTRCTRVFSGSMDALKAFNPAVLSAMSDMQPTDLRVRSTELHPDETSGVGILTIQLDNYGDAYHLSGALVGDSQEMEWQQIERPLEQHPRYTNVSDEERQQVEDKLKDSTKPDPHGGEALELYQKKLRGQTTYLVFAPVVRQVSVSSGRPNTGSCGKISAPPFGPSGYQYLKTADRLSRQDRGLWTRTQEWTGADTWDNDIY